MLSNLLSFWFLQVWSDQNNSQLQSDQKQHSQIGKKMKKYRSEKAHLSGWTTTIHQNWVKLFALLARYKYLVHVYTYSLGKTFMYLCFPKRFFFFCASKSLQDLWIIVGFDATQRFAEGNQPTISKAHVLSQLMTHSIHGTNIFTYTFTIHLP